MALLLNSLKTLAILSPFLNKYPMFWNLRKQCFDYHPPKSKLLIAFYFNNLCVFLYTCLSLALLYMQVVSSEIVQTHMPHPLAYNIIFLAQCVFGIFAL